MQKITTFLWFDTDAEEAMNFYVSIFKNARIVSVNRYGDADPNRARGHGWTELRVDEQRRVVHAARERSAARMSRAAPGRYAARLRRELGA